MQYKAPSVPARAKQGAEARDGSWAQASIWTERLVSALENGVKGGCWYSLMDKVERPYTLWRAWNEVKARQGAAGVDGISVGRFERHSERYRREIEAELQAGAYRPQPVKRVEIPKGDGRTRPLGLPAVKDRSVQTALKFVIEPIFEAPFLDTSYGFRPRRGCKDALRAVDEHLKAGFSWVVDAELPSYFDTIPPEALMAKVRQRISDGRLLALIEAFLSQAILNGLKQWTPSSGTPQGAVISPLLANLFLHYAFDAWMQRHYPHIPFERFADDSLCHCQSLEQAEHLKAALERRFAECGLELHPHKTKSAYCQDDDRRDAYPVTAFDYLGYTFRPRRSKNRWGKYFINFTPAVSRKASKAMRQELRSWKLHLRSDKALDDLARMFNAVIRGWINYYGAYYKSALYPILRQIDRKLVLWATRKFKRLQGHRRRAAHWLARIARRDRWLFAHWRLLYRLAG